MKLGYLYEHYNLNDPELYKLFGCITDYMTVRNIKVVFTDMEPIIETKIFNDAVKLHSVQDKAEKAKQDVHHETCISDGETVFMHHDLEDVGGITGRLYDIIHVGLGHLYQWNCDEGSGLKFFGDNAWNIGSRFFLYDTEKLPMVRDYEEEASFIAMGHLISIFKENSFSEKFTEGYKNFFNDQARTDLDYIIDYYRTGEVYNFFDKWQLNANKITEITITTPMQPRKRDKKPLGLLSVREFNLCE